MKKIDAILLLALLTGLLVASCGGDPRRAADASDSTPAPWDLIGEGGEPIDPTPDAGAREQVATDITADTAPLAEPEADEGDDNYMADTPDADSVPPADLRRFRGMGRLADLFNDSNKYQYAAGERIGIRPISGVAEAYFIRRPLVHIRSCQWYHVEPLTHSVPYLVPEAAKLLETIGRSFQDSLARRNMRGHTIRVTSVLRTAQSVKRLRRVNRNATDSSTHKLGTTFDISYARFDHDGKSPRVSDEELKYVLAEVLRDLRRQNKCMVKFERKSPCFHITATGR